MKLKNSINVLCHMQFLDEKWYICKILKTDVKAKLQQVR